MISFKLVSVLVLGLCLADLRLALLELDDPTTFSMYYQTFPIRDSYFDHIPFYLTYDSNTKSANREVSFCPDLSSMNMIVNEVGSDSKVMQWGVICPTRENDTIPIDSHLNCWSNPPPQIPAKYRLGNYTYRLANSIFLFKNVKIDKFNPNTTLGFQLGQNLALPDWPLGSTGVLGLSPNEQNTLWSYLFKYYSFKENNIVFSFVYKAGDSKDKWNPHSSGSFGTSQFHVNGYDKEVLGKKGLYYVRQGEKDNSWSLPSVSVNFKTTDGEWTEMLKGKACLTNTYHSFLAGPNMIGTKLLKYVARQMCGKDDCGDEVLLDKAPFMVITVQLQDGDLLNITIRPENFVYTENERTQVSYSDINDWKDYGCKGDYDLAFGRLFFLSTYLVFEVSKAGTRRIGLGEFNKVAKATESEKAVMLFFISICIFCVIAAGVYNISKVRQEEVYDMHNHNIMDNETAASGDYVSMAQQASDKSKDSLQADAADDDKRKSD